MSFDITRENIATCRVLTAQDTYALVDGTALLPDAGADTYALLCDADAHVTSCTAGEDVVDVAGQVVFRLLYSAGEKLSSIAPTFAFSQRIEMPGAKPGMAAECTLSPKDISAQLSGAKANLHSALAMRCRVIENNQTAMLASARGEEVHTLSEEVAFLAPLGTACEKMLLEGQADLPYGFVSNGILLSEANAMVLHSTAGDGEASINGRIDLTLWHAMPLADKPIARTAHSFPFSMNCKLAGLSPDVRLHIDLDVSDLSVRLSEPRQDAALTVFAEGVLAASVLAEKPTKSAYIKDIYATSDKDITLQSERVTIKSGTTQVRSQSDVRLTLDCPQNEAPISAVLACFVRPSDYQVLGDDLLEATGLLEAVLLYMPKEGILPRALHQTLPFTAHFDARPLANGAYDLKVMHVDTTQTASDKVEMKVTLALDGQGDVLETLTLPVSWEETDAPAARPTGVSVYYVRPGDTIWQVAKTYRTPVQEIRARNPGGELTPGQQLVMLIRGNNG